MSRAGLGLALVWLLSAAALFLRAAADPGLSPVALACLPWLVWATLPRSGSEPAAQDALAAWLAAPLVVLALALERARGRELGAALLVAGAFALLAGLYGAAARRPGRALYASAWFALVVGVPLLSRVLESAGAPLFGRAPRALEFAAQASPLGWSVARLQAPAAGAGLELPWTALGLGAALWLAGRAWEARTRT
jgi:hypothetical protein